MRAVQRRRGRAIRRARRLAAAGVLEVTIVPDTRAFSSRLTATATSLSSAACALSKLSDASVFTLRVAFERFGLAYLSPRAGTRRQLLEQGRAPRGGR